MTSISSTEKPASERGEVDAERRELDLQEIDIPAGSERELVVGEAQGSLLQVG